MNISYLATHFGGQRLPGIEHMIPADVLDFVERRSPYMERLYVQVTAWAFVHGKRAVQVMMINPEAAADLAFPLFEYLDEEASDAFRRLASS